MKCKALVVVLSFIFIGSGFGVKAFLGSAYAQDKKIVSKKHVSQSPVKKWRVVTAGEHGQFKGFDGFQMALNMAQDMDEIRIEKGAIDVSGLVIPQNKEWEHGIKISGGWDEAFGEKSNNPEDTALDGGGKDNRILTISNQKGKVFIENLMFKNSKDGAVKGNGTFSNCIFTKNLARGGSGYSGGGAVMGDGTFSNCTFINNSVDGYGGGGAVKGNGTFSNCTFTNNTTSGFGGGAVAGYGNFSNCTFTNNSANADGGAVDGGDTFSNCTFTNNSASKGGAVKGNGKFMKCSFVNNLASDLGGAVDGSGTFSNCTFTNNIAECVGGSGVGGGGAVYGDGAFTNCLFANNSASSSGGKVDNSFGGAVEDSNGGTFTNCLFINNSAQNSGGAIAGPGTFTNCIFANNSASSSGGAVYNEFGDYTFINSTFYGNKATGNGGAILGSGKIINSIFYKNTVADKDNDMTVKGNLEIDYSLFNNLSGVANVGANNIQGNPKFVDPDNGDFHLCADSPCMGKGKLLPGRKNAKGLNGKPGVGVKRISMGAEVNINIPHGSLTQGTENKDLNSKGNPVSEEIKKADLDISGEWKGVYNFRNKDYEFKASINISGNTFEGKTDESAIGNPSATIIDGKVGADKKIKFTKIYDGYNTPKVYYSGSLNDDGSIQGVFEAGSENGTFSMQRIQ